jgi:LDH2 family malate/lactate/ureidoglycolate dehydrogenase
MTAVARDVLVQADSLHWLCVGLLERVGVPGDDARFTAETLVEADLRGVTSHGTRALPRYLAALRAGGTNPRPNVRILRQGPAFARLDGDAGLGQVVAGQAMRLAIGLARGAGIGAVAVENSNHYGAAAFYPMMAAEQGMLGLTTTNGGGKNMAPFNGAEPVVGNSPIAFAAPAGDEPPIVLDMATGVVALGKIAVAAMRGERIPLGWGLTADGEHTDDPTQARIVLPLGAKGYGLAMMMDVLSGPLSGALMSVNTTPSPGRGLERPSGCGHFFLALDVAAFTDLDGFRREVDRAVRAVRATRPQRGVGRVYLPGEIEWNTKVERRRSGIPLHEAHAGALAEVAGQLGLARPWSV